MVAKSVIDIDINDAKFKEFLKLFDKYKDALKTIPKGWGSANSAIQDTTESMDELADSAENVDDEISKIEKTLRKIPKSVDPLVDKLDKTRLILRKTDESSLKTTGNFDKIVKNSKSIASNITAASFGLLKMGGLAVSFGAALATGAILGMDKISTGASDLRNQSLSSGATPGELQSAKINYGRYGDVESTLNNIIGAQTDLSKQWAFGTLNSNQSPVKLLPQILQRAAQVWKEGPQASAQQRLHATGLDQFVSVGQARLYAQLSPKEMAENNKASAADSISLNVRDKTLKQWQDLNVQLERSKASVNNSLIVGLGGATPIVESFSKALSDATHAVLVGNGKINDNTGIINSASGFSVNSLLHPSLYSAKSSLTGGVLPPDSLNNLKVKKMGLVNIKDIPNYENLKPGNHVDSGMRGASNKSVTPAWNPTSISLNVKTTKVPGQDTNINMLNSGGYYTGVKAS